MNPTARGVICRWWVFSRRNHTSYERKQFWFQANNDQGNLGFVFATIVLGLLFACS